MDSSIHAHPHLHMHVYTYTCTHTRRHESFYPAKNQMSIRYKELRDYENPQKSLSSQSSCSCKKVRISKSSSNTKDLHPLATQKIYIINWGEMETWKQALDVLSCNCRKDSNVNMTSGLVSTNLDLQTSVGVFVSSLFPPLLFVSSSLLPLGCFP